MRHSGLELGLRSLGCRGEECDEILVLGLRLCQTRCAPFTVIRIRNGQLRLGEVFTVRVGINQRLKR